MPLSSTVGQQLAFLSRRKKIFF